jgi:indoleamine 2,3-dioxygenase
MSGWTDDRMDPGGMVYKGVEGKGGGWRRERYFGETGAQFLFFSFITAIDAALGLSCDASAKVEEGNAVLSPDAARASAMVPYLLAMRQYMPPLHAQLIEAFQDDGVALRQYVSDNDKNDPELVLAFDKCIQVLTEFRTLHLGLAYRFVRQWDERNDDQVIGTGGTAFMPYLRAHRDATKKHTVQDCLLGVACEFLL